MVIKKEDKRVTKTKRDLRNALGNLLKEKPYSKITVCDICDEAVVNRMTFYKHYMDKNDLLSDMFDFARVSESEIEKLKSSDAKCEDIINCILPVIRQCASECVDKKEIIKCMYENESDIIGDVIYKSLHNIAVQVFGVYKIRHRCRYDQDLICEFFVGGLTKVLSSYAALKVDYTKERFISDVISVFEILLRSDIFDQGE
ncbi:MAG: TetR/AcrR family transcriptional regulator [Clostridia bacterium]|nr:TetR/AcrR family transcriptional regulator [Clostridia bacterium]